MPHGWEARLHRLPRRAGNPPREAQARRDVPEGDLTLRGHADDQEVQGRPVDHNRHAKPQRHQLRTRRLHLAPPREQGDGDRRGGDGLREDHAVERGAHPHEDERKDSHD